ncbi:anti-sigma factor domain-containing protein [Nitrospira sp. Kam-Ns4a]
MTAHTAFEEHLELYAIGALDRQDRQALEVHLLAGCPSCHAALKETQAVAGLLPFQLPLIAPPPELRETLVASLPQASPAPTVPKVTVQIERPPEVRLSRIDPRAPWWARLLHPTVLGLVVVALAVYAWSLRSRLPAEVAQRNRVEAALNAQTTQLAALQRQFEEQRRLLDELQSQVAAGGTELNRLREALAEREAELEQARAALAQLQQDARKGSRDELAAFLRSPGVQVIQLVGIERAQSAGALLFFDPDSKKGFFYAFNLPPLPAGKTYQLWAFTVDPKQPKSIGYPVSAGTFRPDAGGKGRLAFKGLPEPASILRFMLSIEPTGGRAQPGSDLLPFQRP